MNSSFKLFSSVTASGLALAAAGAFAQPAFAQSGPVEDPQSGVRSGATVIVTAKADPEDPPVVAEVRERFYAISVERRLKHPAVVAVSDSARQNVFARMPPAHRT